MFVVCMSVKKTFVLNICNFDLCVCVCQWRRGSRMDIGLHGMFPVVVEDRIEILGGGPMFDRGPGFHHEVFAPIWWE
eukprot:m.206555 g.206555  ORF g.206555 m.206555 type:complete len:77 (-) comp13757_c0_seq6:842-1072(-)